MWIVQMLGDPDITEDMIYDNEDEELELGYELSVVVEGSHGTKSWGWPGEEKIILADCPYYSAEQVELLKTLAEQLCNTLNRKEA